MNTTRRAFLGAAVGWSALAAAEDEPVPYDVDEAYDVYSAFLPDEFTVRNTNAKRLVILAECRLYGPCKPDLEPGKDKEVAAAVASFRELNSKRLRLLPKVRASLPYDLVPNAKIDGYFKDHGLDGWNSFFADYPDSGGFLVFAAVGFNVAKTVAVTNIAHSCGGLCGGGRFHFLRKVDGNWSHIRGVPPGCLWMS